MRLPTDVDRWLVWTGTSLVVLAALQAALFPVSSLTGICPVAPCSSSYFFFPSAGFGVSPMPLIVGVVILALVRRADQFVTSRLRRFTYCIAVGAGVGLVAINTLGAVDIVFHTFDRGTVAQLTTTSDTVVVGILVLVYAAIALFASLLAGILFRASRAAATGLSAGEATQPHMSQRPVAAAVIVAVGLYLVYFVAYQGISIAEVRPSGTRFGASIPTISPSATLLPKSTNFADCAAARFGPSLLPYKPPPDLHYYTAPPPMQIDKAKLYQATITTDKGDIVLCLQPDLAPTTVNNFVALGRNHFYDGIPFHRVVEGFVIQGGDPMCIGNVPRAPAVPAAGCGRGDAGYPLGDEPLKNAYVKGCVAMDGGSQFFICTADDTSLAGREGHYNLFGRVESGMSVALQIVQGDVVKMVTVRKQR